MKCPERKIRTVTIQYDEFNELETKRTVKTDFGECIGHECPYYDTKITYVVEGAMGKYTQKATCRMVG